MHASTDDTEEPYTIDETVSHYESLAADKALFDAEKCLFERYFSSGTGRVLDLGCGAGRTAAVLDERGYDVVALDVSKPMIERAQSLFEHLEFQVGDASDLPYADNSFEYVLFAYGGLDAISPATQRQRAIAEMDRVCKTGGIVAFSSHNTLYRYASLLKNPSYFVNYHLLHGNLRNLGKRYKRSAYDQGVDWHFSTPVGQIREGEKQGLSFIEVVGNRDSILRYAESQPYYVFRATG